MRTTARRTPLLISAIMSATLLFWPLPAAAIIPFPKLAALLATTALALFALPSFEIAPIRTIQGLIAPTYAAFAVAMCLRGILSPMPNLGLWGISIRMNGALLYLATAILLWVAVGIRSDTERWQIIRGLVFTGFLSSLYAILQFFKFDVIEWEISGPLSSLGNPDHTASFHAIIVVAAACLACRQSERPHTRGIALLTALGATWVTIYWGQHDIMQGVLLLAIAATAFGVLWSWRRGHRAASISVLAACCIIVVPLLFQVARVDRGTLDRLYMVRAGVRMWSEHPFVGIGISRMTEYFNRYRELSEIRIFGLDRNVDDLHCLPIQILASAGLLAFIPWLIFLISASVHGLRTLLSTGHPDDSGRQVIAGIFVLSAVQSLYSPDSAPLAAMTGIAAGAMLYDDTANERPFLRIPRTVSMTLSLVLALAVAHRGVLEAYHVEADSRVLRSAQPANATRADAANVALAERLQFLLRHYPNDPTFVFKFASRLASADYEEEGARFLERAVAANSLDYISADALAKIYRRQGNLYGVLRLYRLETAALPRDPRGWGKRAMIALSLQDTSDARYSIERARRTAIDAHFGSQAFWVALRKLEHEMNATEVR